jgi:hypothetical protein
VLLASLWGRLGDGGDGGDAGRPGAGGDVFSDTFRDGSLAAGTWETRDRERKLVPAQALLEITGWRAPPAWGDPGLYSVRTLPRRPGRTLAVDARAYVGAVNGPLFLLSPKRFPADPPAGGYGAGFASRLGSGGNGGRDLRLAAVTPAGEIRYGGYVAENHNYLFATTLRPNGSYHFVSGGSLGTFPEATLMWVNERGADGSLHVGVDSRKTQAGVASVRVLDLPGEFATQDGLAIAADDFRRSRGAELGQTPKGGLPWKVEAGEVMVGDGSLVRRGTAEALATVDPRVADGLFEMTFATPTGPYADAALYFRYRDERSWWRVACNAGVVRVEQAVEGAVSTVYQSGAYGCGPRATHRLVVRAHGERLGVWLDDRATGMDEDGLTVPAPESGAGGGDGTRVGVGLGGGAPAPAIKRLAVWPRKVTLPAAVGPFPSPPDAGGPAIATDAFAAPAGTRLEGHRADPGWSWTEHGGTWTITPEGLLPPPDGGAATIDTGLADVTVTATVRLAGGSGWGTTNGWEVGPVLRYTDDRNYLWARFLFQEGSPEVELWQKVDGITSQLNAKNISGLVAPGGTHSLRVAAGGDRLAVYVDGKPVAEATTSLLRGTRAGLVIDDEAVNVSTFTAFEVAPTGADPTPPGPPAAGPPPGGPGGRGGVGPEGPSEGTGAAPSGVPQVALDFGADVEDWWAGHPLNPERPDAVPVGGIGSPEPVLDVAGRFGGNVQAAVDALPPSGGTLYFAPGSYGADFTVAGRSNVHFVSDGGATLRAGNGPVMARIAGCRQALDYGAFVRAVRLDADPQHGNALACLKDRAHNIYFRDLTLDGGGRATTGVALAAVADVVFDRVTFTGFVDPQSGHGGLIDGSEMLDNVWCRECRFVGRQRWAVYLDGLHGGGVINSRIENGFAAGGLLFLTNDDFTRRNADPNAWRPADFRTGAYIVVYGNTFAAGDYQAMGISGRSVLVKDNVAEGRLSRGFAGFDTKSSMIWPDVVYEYFGNKVIGNHTGDLPGLAGFNQASGTYNPAWQNRARIGRYTVRDNLVDGAPNLTTLVNEVGTIDGPNSVAENCVNGVVYGTDRPCP